MCGGEKVNNRSWNINYNGFRREYYIDELFDEQTKTPRAFGMDLLIDTLGFSPVLHLSFNSSLKTDTGWSIGDSLNYTTTLDQGRLCFKSKLNSKLSVILQTKIDFQKDFSLQMLLECPTENVDYQYGLFFGSLADRNQSGTVNSFEYLTINNHQLSFVGNSGWFGFYTISLV